MTFGERNRNPGHHFAGYQYNSSFLFKLCSRVPLAAILDAILSDYDGTLCSTTSVRGDISLVDTITQELEQILFSISKQYLYV
jgi:hypothetical protein